MNSLFVWLFSILFFFAACADKDASIKGAAKTALVSEMKSAENIPITEAKEESGNGAAELGLVSGEASLNWTSATHGISMPGGVAVTSWAQGVFHFFWRGEDCHLKSAWRKNGVWGGPVDLGGCIASAPTAVSWGENRIDVFARGTTNNNLWHIWWDGSNWSGWENMGGVIQDSPSAASMNVGHLDVFARGMDNGLYHRWFSKESHWSGWQALPNSHITSSPSAVSWGPGRMDVFARGSEGGLWQLYFNGGWSNWSRLGSFSIKGSPSVASRGVGKLDVFSRNSANKVMRLSWTGSAWTSLYTYRDFISSVAPASVADGMRETHVFYPSGNSLIQKTGRDNQPIVGANDLSGHVDSVTLEADGSNTIRGWACQIGYNASIPVHIYAVHPAGGLQVIVGAQADEESEQGIANICKTRHYNHRFSAKISPQQAANFSGQLVRVYGIKVAPGSDSVNSPISRSDHYVFRSLKYSRVAAKPGLGIHNTVFSSRPTEVVDDLNAIGSLGVKLVRLEMSPHNNSLLVSALQRAQAHQMDALLMMNLVHGAFYDSPSPGTGGVNKLSAINVSKYKEILKTQLLFLKNQGVTPAALEVGNEIDLHYFNGDIPDHDYQNIPNCPKCIVVKQGVLKMHDGQNAAFNAMLKKYGEILIASYEVRNEVFPNMRLVTFGAYSNSTGLVHMAFRLGGALGVNYLNYVDGFGIHDYGYDSSEASGRFAAVNGTLQTHFGFTKKFWITEFGYGASWWIPGTNGQTIAQNTDARKNWIRQRVDFYGTTAHVETMFLHDFRPTTDHGEKYSVAERTNGQYVMYKESQVFMERGP